MSQKVRPRPLRLDYASPLPPTRSGIADYSADLLPHVAADADLRLVHLPGQDVAPELAERYAVVSPERLGEDGRLPWYQVGNNFYHEAVLELALEQPGLLTLHDVVLHHLLAGRTLARDDFGAYRDALEAEHGWIGAAAALPRRWPGGWGDAAQFALPAHRRVLARQRGVLVHSAWAAEFLREELPGLAARAVPMGVPPGPRFDAAAGYALRQRHGIPESVPLLGSFGFQTPIKRTGVAIRALARPGLEEVHLLVAGEVSEASRLEETARERGVLERVHFLGFLPFDELEAAIAAVDLCLNLRYPTAGETSASLLRILAVGKPAVVSDYAQFAELPDAGVVKVPLGLAEEEILAGRLAELLADSGRLAAMGEAARRYIVEQHDPARSARAMIVACRELAALEPRGAWLPAPRPTSFIWHDLRGTIEVEGAAAPWRAGERRRLGVRLVNHGPARWLAGERPDGGVALAVTVFETEAVAAAGVAAEEVRGGEKRPWLRLPRDLEPGEEARLEFALRRPLGPSRLRIEPHVLGVGSFAELGGPVWEEAIG